MDRRSYSYCSVLLCENNSKNAPEKLFIPVPRKAEIRKKWLQLARREPEKLSIISSLHFCEDHFDTADIQETDRKIFIIRHGERVDLVFPIWISECFDQAGNYIRTDPNMPRSLPKRKRGSLGFPVDAPLTNAGVFQASMIGEQLNYKKDSISHIYCSPALRSIQTANAIIQQLENRDELKIRIEPGLYEMARWYKHFQLDWMSPEELLEAGYNVDVDYKPVFKASDVISNFKETSAQYYERGAAVTDAALKNHPTGNILLVGHASTAEICSHKLLKRRPREYNDLIDFMLQVPFCAMSQLSSVNNQWSIAPYLSVTHSKL